MYNPLATTIFKYDASKVVIGGELSQLQGNGQYKTVSFFSRSLQEFEKKFSVLELELLACICNCGRFERFLWGKHFTLKTDHKSLLLLINGEIGGVVRPLRLAR